MARAVNPSSHTLHTAFFPLVVAACTEKDVPRALDCTTSSLTLSVESVQQASACDAIDGSLTVAADGGEAPYEYSVGGPAQESPGFEGLSPGLYTAQVTDATGCTLRVPFVAIPASWSTATAYLTPDTSSLEGTGGVTVAVADGTPP